MKNVKFVIEWKFPLAQFPTIKNDGSKQGSPCHKCDGKLLFKPVRGGGFILGCSNYESKNCRFKMHPNPDEVTEFNATSLLKREARALRKAEKENAEREKQQIKDFGKDAYCVRCGEQLPFSLKSSTSVCVRCSRKLEKVKD